MTNEASDPWRGTQNVLSLPSSQWAGSPSPFISPIAQFWRQIDIYLQLLASLWVGSLVKLFLLAKPYVVLSSGSFYSGPLPKTHLPMWFSLITLSLCINLSAPITRWKGPGLFKKWFVSVHYENSVFHCPIFIQAYSVLIMFHFHPTLSNHSPSPS